jgi:putative transposase
LRLDFQDGISQRQEAVRALEDRGLSRVRACTIVVQPRRTLYYRRKLRPHDTMLIERTQTLAQERPRFGWRRLIIMVRRGMVGVGESRSPYLSTARPSSPSTQEAQGALRSWAFHLGGPSTRERGSIDFMHDRYRKNDPAMNVVDDFTRECLAIDVAFSFGSHDVFDASSRSLTTGVCRR